MAAPDLRHLQEELTATLRRADKNRRVIRLTQTPLYLLALLWLLFVLVNTLTGGRLVASDPTQPGAPSGLMLWVFPAFVLIFLLQTIFSRAYAAFARQEQEIVGRVVRSLFPDARYHTTAHNVPASVLRNSLLFPDFGKGDSFACGFASLDLETEGGKLNITDLGVTTGHSASSARGVLAPYKHLLRSLFASRADRAIFDFRGMFGWADLTRRVPGSIVILPDRIEGRLGYLAHTLQGLKKSGDRHLVRLEDPEFERHFAVYATDEVLARYILTPAMMRDITRLREQFGREMMLSFNADKFCIAISMPAGFLSLRSEALNDGHIVEEIFRDIETTRTLLSELHLEKETRQTQIQ